MTNRIFRTLGAASLVALFTVAASPSQAGDISAKVPFSFTVNGSKSLPPGQYTLSTSGAVGTMLVRSANDGAFSTTSRLQSRNQDEPKLVFHKYGDTYVLRQVWLGGGVGRELPQSRFERELAERKMTSNIESVTVAAQ
jgi:hypothetical protein